MKKLSALLFLVAFSPFVAAGDWDDSLPFTDDPALYYRFSIGVNQKGIRDGHDGTTVNIYDSSTSTYNTTNNCDEDGATCQNTNSSTTQNINGYTDIDNGGDGTVTTTTTVTDSDQDGNATTSVDGCCAAIGLPGEDS